jgi:hypothetical protein
MTLDYSALANAILQLEKSLAYAHSPAALDKVVVQGAGSA